MDGSSSRMHRVSATAAASLVVLGVALAPRTAGAGGLGVPTAPMGTEDAGSATRSWFLGAAAATTATTLSFPGNRELDIVQYALAASLGYLSKSGWSVRTTLGVVLDGALEGQGLRYDIGPGIIGAVGASKKWVFGRWFLSGTAGAGVTRATTTLSTGGTTEILTGFDAIRAGVMLGRTFGNASPYVAARGFVGPVLWRLETVDVRGIDKRKYQFGGGVNVTTPSGVSLLIDLSVLGERSASLAMSYRL